MRNTSALDPILSRPTQEILSALLLERADPWYLSDLAKRLGRTPSTLQRPLDALVTAGILRRWTEGNRVYFEREEQCPILPELQSILKKTAGLMEVLRGALAKFAKRITLAFVYGSLARGSEQSGSDVDLLVVGNLSLAELSPVLTKVEQKLGRPVNIALFPISEFSQKLASKNHFLRSVLAHEKIFLWGNMHELEKITVGGKSRSARHK